MPSTGFASPARVALPPSVEPWQPLAPVRACASEPRWLLAPGSGSGSKGTGRGLGSVADRGHAGRTGMVAGVCGLHGLVSKHQWERRLATASVAGVCDSISGL